MDEDAVREQRRFRRYDLKLPVELIRAGSHRLSRLGRTRNLSSGGVLFKLHFQLELGDPIEYFITLPFSPGPGADVRLLCRGKVVRLERPKADVATASGKLVAVAATLERHEFVRPSHPQAGRDSAGRS
jgi:hypothetical protein